MTIKSICPTLWKLYVRIYSPLAVSAKHRYYHQHQCNCRRDFRQHLYFWSISTANSNFWTNFPHLQIIKRHLNQSISKHGIILSNDILVDAISVISLNIILELLSDLLFCACH